MIYRHVYAFRRFADRNRDFIEHVAIGAGLLLALLIFSGWL